MAYSLNFGLVLLGIFKDLTSEVAMTLCNSETTDY